MPEGATLRVSGYRDFLRAADRAGPDSKRAVRGVFKQVAENVRTSTAAQFTGPTARGFRTVVRLRGISVEQRLGKTTGLHPEFGARQLGVLTTQLDRNESLTVEAMERALDRVADHFERD